MSPLYPVGYAVAAVASVLLASVAVLSRYRNASLWFRLGFFLVGPLGLSWSGLGVYLDANQQGERSLLTWSRFWALDHIKANLAGLVIGMVLCLLLSPEFRSYVRRKPTV